MMAQQQRTGDLLAEVRSGVIVQQVNAQGAMGSGFARAVRARYPRVWEEYSAVVRPGAPDGGLQHLGRLIVTWVDEGLLVASVVGQQFYGRLPGHRYTSYDSLDAGLAELAARCSWGRGGEAVLHYPLLGCGLGGGDWGVVSAIVDARLGEFERTLWTLPE
jgi:O-acetyl-ADP-ribose deacetylase (regulator of RNase III)